MSNSHWFEHARWFEEARFGMFITWSPIYATGDRNGWFIDFEGIPPEEFEKWAETFNPKVDMKDWVALAKEAGMKYICFSAKSHDGFCMFDTKMTPFNSMNIPAQRDFVAELAQACEEEGIVLCLYYSLLDWHQPDYRTDFKKYVDFCQEQLRELATKYGKIGVFWFDGDHTAHEWRAEETIQLLRELQPNVLVNNRIRLAGDFDTPEQRGVAFPVHPGTGDRFFESCMTINGSWSYAPYDLAHKSVTTLIRLLADNAGKGGNFLLNVAPDFEGRIQSEHVERLREVGAWLKEHGESIYCTQGSLWRALPFGRCTVRDNRIYLHIFDWPNQPLSLSGLTNRVKSAYLLPNKESVSFEQDRLWLTLHLLADAPNPHDSVVVLEIEGEPQVDETIQPDPQRCITLPASLATVMATAGMRFQQGLSGPGYLADWKSMRDSIGWGWDLNSEAEGDYQVQITYSNGQQLGGGRYSVTVNGQRLVATAMPTGGWDRYAAATLGSVKLKSGRNRLVLRGELLPYESVMRLVQVILKPTKV